jgi:ankyrin repeat protein
MAVRKVTWEWFSAAFDGNVKVLQRWIERGVDVNCRTESGGTALMYASSRGRLEAITLLLNVGADSSIRDNGGLTVFGWAATHKQPQILALLRHSGVKPANLFDAATVGDVESINSFLAQGADVNSRIGNGWRPLMSAAIADQGDAVHRLLEAGAKIDVVDSDGMSALNHTAETLADKAAAVLLEHGADPNRANKRKETSLMTAAIVSQEQDAVPFARFLLTHGAAVDSHDRVGRTALWWAVAKGNMELAKLLLDEGADARKVYLRDDENDYDALQYAEEKAAFDLIDLIRSRTSQQYPSYHCKFRN